MGLFNFQFGVNPVGGILNTIIGIMIVGLMVLILLIVLISKLFGGGKKKKKKVKKDEDEDKENFNPGWYSFEKLKKL